LAPLGWADLDLMFVTSVGTILDRKTLRKDIDAIQKPAKLTRIRLYATRSTHGSLLADMGVNLHALARAHRPALHGSCLPSGSGVGAPRGG
jgi:hypothetical protein